MSKLPREIKFFQCWGSVSDPCPYREKETLVNFAGEKTVERVRVMGSSSCTCCKFYVGRGEYFKKSGTGYTESVLCNHPYEDGK